jgi:PAS domain S-box-containing protein
MNEIATSSDHHPDVQEFSGVVLQPDSFSGREPRGSLKVLVADDDPVTVVGLTGLLTEWGYDPVAATMGHTALELLCAKDGPSIAVLDWMLPDIYGTEICRRLRTSQSLRYHYLILLTGRDDANDVVAGLGAGADDYLRKPYDPLELRARIDAGSRIVVQKALRESEQRFQGAFEHAGVGMALVDLTGKWLQVNSALCDFLGYKRSELTGTSNFQTVTHLENLPKSPQSAQEVDDRKPAIAQIEQRYLHKDGHAVWGLLTVSPVSTGDGRPVYFVAQIQDISQRKHAEDALRASHAESELFINSVPSILIGTDAHGRITRWNLAAADTFALPASAVRGKSLKDCGITWLSPDIETEIDSWLRIEKGGRRSDLLFQKDGSQHFLGLSVNKVTFAQEKSLGLLITGVDITERRHLEEQLRQAQKLEAIGQLAAGIAHEINTPTQYVGDNTTFIKQSWSAISNLARAAQQLDEESQAGATSQEATARLHQCIKDADLDYLLEEMPNAVDQSLEGVQRVAKIVRAMKEFSHPGSEEKTALDINRAIETTITVARNEWKYVSDMETCLDHELPQVQCHAGELNQVILNLLINAAHAIRQVVGDGSDRKGKIRVATTRDQDGVEISIQDSGCGIPEAIQSRVFEPFFTTKPVGQGTGQGLALAHTTIVRRHGGRIWFETAEGKGTTFFLRLPISSPPAES